MADDESEAPEDGDETADDTEAAPVKKRRIKGKTLILFVVLPVLLLGGGGGAAYFMGLFEGEASVEEIAVAKPKVFFDLPEMLVNLASRGERRAQYLKLELALELPDAQARSALTPVLPRVIDLFQVYLRELRPTDLEGSAGIFRLKEELVRRVNLEIQPHQVTDVLFKQIIVQ